MAQGHDQHNYLVICDIDLANHMFSHPLCWSSVCSADINVTATAGPSAFATGIRLIVCCTEFKLYGR